MTTPGRADLADTLLRLVETSQLRPAEVARRAGISDATVSRYLHGKVVPSPAAVKKLVAATGSADTTDAEQAVQLAEDLRVGAASRVVLLRPGTATSQRRFREIEAGSAHVAAFTPLIVPGLLQIEPYARAVFKAGGQSGAVLEENLAERLGERQALLNDPDHRFTLIMTEGALRWHVVGPTLMVEQLEHIARWTQADTGERVRIGLIPWTTPVDLFPLTNFDVYDDRAVIVGTDFGTSYLDRPRDVAVYVEQFRQLAALAVFGDDQGRVVLGRIADDYRALAEGRC